MSYDRALDQVCPHQVVEEALFFRDRQVVRPLRPIAASVSVKVRLNRLLEVPSEGVHTPATTAGGKSGPFDIVLGNNDTLVIQVGAEPIQTLRLPYGKGLSADVVVRTLNNSVRGAYFETSPKQRIVVKTSAMGPNATLKIFNTSTALQVLGISAYNRVWRGKTIAPGWSIVSDPNTLTGRPHRLIVFDQPLKGLDDFVEVDYTTILQECRRCGGVGLENDWRYSKGTLVTIRNEDLLNQEFTKMVYTIKKSNPFHLWYGTGIINAIGQKINASGITQNMIVSDIHEAFRQWQDIKRQQEEKLNQAVSDEEYPFRLLSVNLTQNDQDPTIFNVSTTIQNRSSRPVTIERRVKVPDSRTSTPAPSLSNYTLVK